MNALSKNQTASILSAQVSSLFHSFYGLWTESDYSDTVTLSNHQYLAFSEGLGALRELMVCAGMVYAGLLDSSDTTAYFYRYVDADNRLDCAGFNGDLCYLDKVVKAFLNEVEQAA